MSIEGELTIELERKEGSVSRVTIGSARPMQVTRMFEGRTPEELLTSLPLVYSVCGTAQLSASLGACEQAFSKQTHHSTLLARRMLVWMETAREHLLRILLDWSDFLDETVERDNLQQVNGLLLRMRRALYGNGTALTPDTPLTVDHANAKQVITELDEFTAKVLGSGNAESPSPLQSLTNLNRWIEEGGVVSARLLREVRDRGWSEVGRCDMAFLPELDGQALHQRLTADDAGSFIAEPRWQGDSYETTPLTRQKRQPLVEELLASLGNGLMTRLVARLVELSRIPLYLQQWLEELEAEEKDAPKQEPARRSGIGLAQVEAARGRLVHRVEIEEGLVRRYQILAPTEWNFHPEGVAARGLQTLEADSESELRRQAALLINAVDPCVGYSLHVH